MSTRYSAQTRLSQVGQAGQAALASAHVLVVGAGGLGCASLPLLAGAELGVLRVIDPDQVEESNLHRQTLYRMSDIGRPKVHAAAEALTALNPDVTVCLEHVALDPANARRWVDEADVVVDAADHMAVTYALSDICHQAGKPLISASAQGMEGYAGVFCGGAPSYRAVFPDWPTAVLNCSSAGVLGPVVALLGCLQAQLVLALLLKLPSDPRGRLWRWDGQRMAFAEFDFRHAAEPPSYWPLLGRTQLTSDDLVIDLRSQVEAPSLVTDDAIRCEVSMLASMGDLPRDRRIVFACRSGFRAARAAEEMARIGYTSLALLASGATPATQHA